MPGGRLSGERAGITLVMASAIVWSFGGAIARLLTTDDSWTIVFLRSIWAAAFLILFLLWRDGRKTILLFKTMGYPGIAVAVCFATASGAFIVALQHTTVANILLIQASTPLVAALIGRLVFKEKSRARYLDSDRRGDPGRDCDGFRLDQREGLAYR